MGLSFGFTFAYPWLQFLGFSLGLGFIQENCVIYFEYRFYVLYCLAFLLCYNDK